MPRTSSETQNKSPYGVHPSVAMAQKVIAGLKGKTGRSLEEWIELVKESGPPAEKDRHEWLKKHHKLGTNYAWWIVERAEGRGLEDGDPEAYLKAAAAWVETMFSGAKSGLRPIFDRLLTLGRKLGKDVKICPCQTIVPLYREHVFAQIKPTTRTRIDLGLALPKMKPRQRLIDTGGFEKKDRITYRIPITALAEIDDEVHHWLKAAYDRDA